MKQFAFLSILLAATGIGAFYSPFWGVLMYYFLAVLRPQYLWEWALPGDTRWSLMAAGILFFSVVLFAPRILLRARLNTVAWIVIAYTILICTTVVTAHDPGIAQTWAIEFIKIILVVLVASLIIDRTWQINLIGLMILLALGYGAYEINFHYFIEGRLDIFHVGFGGLDNNGAGLMIAMGIPVAYVFGVCSRQNWQRAIAWTLSLLMLHAMLMSYSRGAMLATVVGAIWLLLHHRPRWQAAGLAMALCLCVSLLAGKEIRERFFSTKSYEEDNSAQSRFDSWAAAWKIASDYPLLGVGLRNSSLYSQHYGADLKGRTIHSQYLQIAADCGLIAMTLYIVLILASINAYATARAKCMAFLAANPHTGPPDRQRWMLQLSERLALGLQTSLIVFAFGGLFLSLEVFELPWLLIMLAGVFPRAVDKAIEDFAETPSDALQPTTTPSATPPRYPPQRKALHRTPHAGPRRTGLASG